MSTILVIDDDALIREMARDILEGEGHRTLTAGTVPQGLGILASEGVDVLILDLVMPGRNGMEAIPEIRHISPGTVILMLTGHPSLDSAVEAMKLGAYDYIRKPLREEEFLLSVKKALEKRGIETENRNLLRKLEEYNRTLEQKVEEKAGEIRSIHEHLLQTEKLSCIGQLAAGMAHEVNNPISYIKSNVGLLKECFLVCRQGMPPDKKALAQELFSEIMDGIVKVERIVSALKKFARTSEWRTEQVDINSLFDDALRLVSNYVKYKAEVKKDYGHVPRLSGHPQELTQVFINLLTNAADAIGKHGTISVKTSADDHMVAVRVSDTGCGIPRENLVKIFDPFFTTKPPGKGTGLGLYIAYQAVEAHDGKIFVDSEEGKGTIFTVEIPVEEGGAW